MNAVSVDQELEHAAKRGWRVQSIAGIGYAGDRDGDVEQTIANSKQALVQLMKARDRREGRLEP
jgi:hypothetical protein